MQLCTSCGLAPLATEDRYCFVCGVALRGLELCVTPDHVVAHGEAEGPAWLQGRVRNTGQFGVRATLARPDVPWLTLLASDADAPLDEGWTLAPGAEARFRVQVKPDPALDGPLSGTLRLEGIATPGKEALQHIRIFPTPRVSATIAGVLPMDQRVAPELSGELTVLSGGGTRAVSVAAGASWAEALLRGGTLTVAVDMDALRQALGPDRPTHVSLPLHVTLADPGVEVEHPLSIGLRWPAYMAVRYRAAGEEHDGPPAWTLTTGRHHVLSAGIANAGGSVLGIREMVLEPTEAPLYWIDAPPDPAHPWEVRPGETRWFRVAVDLRAWTAERLEAVLRVAPTRDGEPEQLVPLRITVTSLPVFRGAVGLDFGTSNSCVVLWPADEPEPRPAVFAGTNVRTGESVREGGVPSTVLYRSAFGDGMRSRDVGLVLAANSQARRLVHSVKRYLGEGRSFHPWFVDERASLRLSAAEVAGDIIQSLLWDAEVALGARLTECMLTHPVRFSTLQIAELKRMLAAFGVEVAGLLPEPVAAAVNFAVAAPNADEVPRHYSILVFDIGGGTTDIALLRVRDEIDTEQQVRTITPELLGVDGNRWAGGDDLTWSLLAAAFSRNGARDVLAKAISDDFSENDLARVEAAVHSRDPVAWWEDGAVMEAFAAAEEAKRSRADEAWNPAGGDLLESRGTLLPDHTDLEKLANEFYESHDLGRMAGKLLEQADGGPDVILLVGQTWRIKALRERVAREFPAARVHPSAGGGLKLPVATGACRVHQFADDRFGYRLDTSLLAPLVTARIGLVRGSLTTGRREFVEVVGSGQRLGEWCRVPGRPRPGAELEIHENTGYADDLTLEVAGRPVKNREIRMLGTVSILPPTGTDPDRTQLGGGSVHLRVNEDHQVEAKLVLDDVEWLLAVQPVT